MKVGTPVYESMFAAAQAAQKYHSKRDQPANKFAAAQAAQKKNVHWSAGSGSFAAAQAAQKSIKGAI